jgi:NAD(P)-dependent dehydrogenase (short-subunit alcohol dehydrogenase family)
LRFVQEEPISYKVAFAPPKTLLITLAAAEDIADTISFLASDKSNYLIGKTIGVNDGQFVQ